MSVSEQTRTEKATKTERFHRYWKERENTDFCDNVGYQ